jgi:hypothetical protein
LTISRRELVPLRFERFTFRNRIVSAFFHAGLFQEALSTYLSVVAVKPSPSQ